MKQLILLLFCATLMMSCKKESVRTDTIPQPKVYGQATFKFKGGTIKTIHENLEINNNYLSLSSVSENNKDRVYFKFLMPSNAITKGAYSTWDNNTLNHFDLTSEYAENSDNYYSAWNGNTSVQITLTILTYEESNTQKTFTGEFSGAVVNRYIPESTTVYPITYGKINCTLK